MFRNLLPILASVAVLGLSEPDPALAQGCLSQGDIRAAVASGQIVPFSAFSGGLKSIGKVVSSCLRPGGGGYVYVAQILMANGQMTQVTLDARTGARY